MAVDLNQVPPPATGPGDAQRNARYAYLVGRLRNRQMTMEEATELFGIMQGMLRQGEAARQALMRMPPSSPALGLRERPPAPAPAAPSTASDDFFLLGILAMGAGAGLLAAMTKRMQDLTPPAAPEGRGRPERGASSR
jgi:hypothetical protein